MESLAMAGGLSHEHWPAALLLLFLAAVAVHEVGHFLAGVAVGFHFNSIQIGPLFVEDSYGALRAYFSLDMMALGYSAMYADKARKLRRRLLIYIAGGPVANLLCIIAVAVIGHLLPRSDSNLATAAGQFGAISLLLAMVSLLPIATTDGGLIEMLLTSPFAARRFISTVALGAQFTQGVRARNWRKTWINAATYIPDKSRDDFYANWMAYLSASDRKDAVLSARHLECCLSLTPALTNRLRSLLAHEAVVHCAWSRRDLNLAERWLTQVKRRRLLAPIDRARIQVALCCARHNFDDAATTCEAALSLFQQMPAKPYIRALQESWVEWRTEIQERKTLLSTSDFELNRNQEPMAVK